MWALHVNYGLRAEADDDEAHCVEFCERLGVELFVHRAGEPAGNVQAWAREVRYAQAERLAAPRDALIATGHTATDQVETVLYRLAASPGRRALLGMPERSGRIIRPLLHMTREDTAAYCRERGLPWREDREQRGLGPRPDPRRDPARAAGTAPGGRGQHPAHARPAA